MQEKSARELLKDWLEAVMADKVMFNAVVDKKLTETIGLKENTLEKTIAILRNAAKELAGQKLATGTITKVLIEKQKGLWKIIVFKERLPG
ncbi:MAG: hypothetical protein ACYC5N_06675 [Endomicrobiales bacterium]